MGEFELDPFSNPRSHIKARVAVTLERGGDGFGRVGSQDPVPGWYRCDGLSERNGELYGYASPETKVWLQPPYSKGFVERVFRHYGHTQWVALLRFDPRPPWFSLFYEAAELVAVIRKTPDGRPFGFEPPPGIKASSNSFPHALFFRDARDATPDAIAHCIAWKKRSTR